MDGATCGDTGSRPLLGMEEGDDDDDDDELEQHGVSGLPPLQLTHRLGNFSLTGFLSHSGWRWDHSLQFQK